MAKQHFCENPQEAVCGYTLVVGDNWSRFYDETTNSFAHVTCEDCRTWLHDNRFASRGFSDPPEWRMACWKLWLDDQIHDPDASSRWVPTGFIGAASTAEAIKLVERLGPPSYIDFDHDLGMLPSGEEDNAKAFCKWLFKNYPRNPPKDWHVHSQNKSPDVRGWIDSYLGSWARSLKM